MSKERSCQQLDERICHVRDDKEAWRLKLPCFKKGKPHRVTEWAGLHKAYSQNITAESVRARICIQYGCFNLMKNYPRIWEKFIFKDSSTLSPTAQGKGRDMGVQELGASNRLWHSSTQKFVKLHKIIDKHKHKMCVTIRRSIKNSQVTRWNDSRFYIHFVAYEPGYKG